MNALIGSKQASKFAFRLDEKLFVEVDGELTDKQRLKEASKRTMENKIHELNKQANYDKGRNEGKDGEPDPNQRKKTLDLLGAEWKKVINEPCR